MQDPLTDTGVDDWTLYEKFCGGDLPAFHELFGRYRSRLLNLAYRYVRDRQAAEDVAQDVLIKVFEKKAKRDPRALFSTWAYRVTVNAAMDLLRRRRRSSSPPSAAADRADPSASPSAAAEADERGRLVRLQIDALAERLRVPLVLYQYENKSHSEIAAILGLSPKAVERRIHRAREILRARLLKYL